MERLPEAQRAVPDRQDRGLHAAALAVPQQVGPRLSRLAVPVGERDEFLAAIGTDPDHHQQAHLVGLQPHLQVDAVHPQVHIIDPRQRPVVERAGLVLPLPGEPGDRRRRQPRRRPAELLQGGHEVPAGQPVQVQQGQHVGHLRRLPRPRRQDRRREPPPLTRGLIDALVVDPRRPDRYRTRGGGHLPRLVVAVADHQPPAVGVELVGALLDVGGDLSLQRRSQHPPGTLPGQLVQHRPTHRGRGVLVGLVLVVDYRKHGRTFPNQRVNAGPDQSYSDFRSSSGRCALHVTPPRTIHRF
jgi:hypothetical protein